MHDRILDRIESEEKEEIPLQSHVQCKKMSIWLFHSIFLYFVLLLFRPILQDRKPSCMILYQSSSSYEVQTRKFILEAEELLKLRKILIKFYV